MDRGVGDGFCSFVHTVHQSQNFPASKKTILITMDALALYQRPGWPLFQETQLNQNKMLLIL